MLNRAVCCASSALLTGAVPAPSPCQVMPPFDSEMVEPVQERMVAKGVNLCLGDGLKAFEQRVSSTKRCCGGLCAASGRDKSKLRLCFTG